MRAFIDSLTPLSLQLFVANRYEMYGQWVKYDQILPQDIDVTTDAEKGVAIQRAALTSLSHQPWFMLKLAAENWWAQAYVPELMAPEQSDTREQIAAGPHPFGDRLGLALNRPPTSLATLARIVQVGLIFASVIASLLVLVPLV